MAVAFPVPRIAGVCSDGELIQRTGEGDRAAFDKLYRRYARPVFGLALRRLGDRGRAEDAVQETFVSIWRSASTYKPERGPGAPWLYGVARNAIVDRSRARNEPAGRGSRRAVARARGPTTGRSSRGRSGRFTAPSSGCRSASARSSPLRTGAISRRAKSPHDLEFHLVP